MTQSPEATQQPAPTGPEPGSAPGIAGEVAAALSRLADQPVEEHPEVYEALHRRLGDMLSGVDNV